MLVNLLAARLHTGTRNRLRAVMPLTGAGLPHPHMRSISNRRQKLLRQAPRRSLWVHSASQSSIGRLLADNDVQVAPRQQGSPQLP